jgi:vacuolar-type H+-ATPase subunit E/Vma4
MPFAKLKETILAEARQQAQAVSDKIRQQTKAEEQRIAEQARQLEETIIRQAEQEGMRRARQLHQETELQARAAVLRAKEVELTKTKQMLVEQMLSMNNQQTTHLLQDLLKLIPDEAGTIVAGSIHRSQLEPLLPKTLKLAQGDLTGEGGFVYRSQSAELNLTISHLVDRLFVKHRSGIARTSFS